MIRAGINRLDVLFRHARLFELGLSSCVLTARNFGLIIWLTAESLVVSQAESQGVVDSKQSLVQPQEIYSIKSGDTNHEISAGLTDDRSLSEILPSTTLASSGFQPTQELSLLTLSFKMAVGLACVVILVWGIVYLIRRSGLGQQFTQVGTSVKILERSYLAPKKTIVLVSIGEENLALGVTDSNINVLHTWQPGELVLSGANHAQSTFASQFRTLVKRHGSEGQEQMSKDSAEKAGS